MKMIAILVLIVSLNAIQCQKYCDLLQTNGKYDGIQVFFSDILNGNVMYKNGKQWKFGIENRNITMEKELTLGNDHYNTAIINRFGVDGYDCDVKYQPGSNATIMTNCSDGSEDKTSQYDPKGVIFQSEIKDWFIIYSKNDLKITCYSIKHKTIVKTYSECKQKLENKTQFIESMGDSIKKKIDGIIHVEVNNIVYIYYIFFSSNGMPFFCTQAIDDINCNSEKNWFRVLPECFPTSAPPPPKRFEIYIMGAIIGVFVVILVILSLFIIQQKRKSTSSVETNESTIDTKKETIKRLTKENEVLRKTLTEKQSSKQSKALLKTPQSRLTDKSSVKTSVVEPKRGTATQKPNTKSPTKDRKTVSPDKTSPKNRFPKVKN